MAKLGDMIAGMWRRVSGQRAVVAEPFPELPEDHWMKRAHAESLFNRGQIEASDLCGCFCCVSTFNATDITE